MGCELVGSKLFVKKNCVVVFLVKGNMGTLMTQKRILIPIIAVLFAVGIHQAYAEEVTVNVPFISDTFGCFYAYDAELNQFSYKCTWNMTPTDKEITIIAEDNPELVPEHIVDAIIEKHLVTIEPPKPKTVYEIEIEKLQKKLAEEGKLVSHESQLLQALLSLQKECELGTEEGAPIQNYEVFLIATFEPYTHTDLGTQYILKQIEIAIQECKAQQILKKKILGPQYLHIPSTNEPKIVYQTNATLPEDAQAKYDEAKMTDYFAQKSIDTAEGFQCSILGKQQGHCIKQMEDIPIPETTISSQGQAIKNKYKAYLETGLTEIPKQEPDAEPDRSSTTRQYLAALGWSDEKIDAAIKVLEDDNNDESSDP